MSLKFLFDNNLSPHLAAGMAEFSRTDVRVAQVVHGLSVFVLDRQWAGKPFWEMSARFVEWWPTILGVAELTSKAAYRVPYKRQGQKTLEQIRA